VAKIALLKRELAFNEAVAGALESLQLVVGLVDGAGEALGEEEVARALEKGVQAERVLGTLEGEQELARTRAVGLVGRRVAAVRERVVEEVRGCWRKLVGVEGDKGRVHVLKETDGTCFWNYSLAEMGLTEML
jgi:hypothetical protein